MRPRVRALLYAAGFGTRLRPLTYDLPKPLLPVAGLPVAGLTLDRLAEGGCEVAALNLHHLGDAIRTELGRRWRRLPLEYSIEEPEILGTLGALPPIRPLLRDCDAVLLVNGDTLCRWPVRRIVRRHLRSGAAATLLLAARSPSEALGGGVGIDRGGRVVALRDLEIEAPRRRHVFAGLHVLSPELLDRIEPGFGDIVEGLYQPLLREGKEVQTLTIARAWHDMGTPARYLEACLDALRSLGAWSTASRPGWVSRRATRSWVSPLARRDGEGDERARITRSSIERGAVVEAGARLVESVVLEGATIGRGARLRRVVVGPRVEIPRDAQIEGRLVTRADPGRALDDGQSVMGDLLYTPLGD